MSEPASETSTQRVAWFGELGRDDVATLDSFLAVKRHVAAAEPLHAGQPAPQGTDETAALGGVEGVLC